MLHAARRLGATWTRWKAEPAFAALTLCVVALAAALILWPILEVLITPKLEDYMAFFGKPRWLRPAMNSLFLTAVATVTCTAVAFLFAFAMTRLDIPLKGLFNFVVMLPIVSPPFIVSLAYILLFGAQGLVTKKLLGLDWSIYGWRGLLLVQTVSFFPYAYAVMRDVMRNIPPHLEQAAHNLGASNWEVFSTVFWPLCRPGVAGGALMAAINVLTDFGNPMIIGGNFRLLPTEAYMQIAGWYNMGMAAVMSTVLLIPAAGLFLFNRYWLGKRSYVTVSGKGNSLEALPFPPLVKWTIFAACLAIALFILTVYGILFFGSFTMTWGYDWTPTLKNFAYVWARRGDVANSLMFAAAAAVLAATLGMLLAYLVQRRLFPLPRLLDFLAVLPGAVPGVFLGLGFAIAFSSGPLDLSGTALIMILALAVWNVPACYSACLAGLQQIATSMEESARTMGAGSVRSLVDVTLPLLRGSFLAGLSLSFMRSITCLSVVIFIYSSGTIVSTISILSLVSEGNWGGAAAFTTVVISLAFSTVWISRGLSKHFAGSGGLISGNQGHGG